ncbi:MAG TPA: SCO family protein [Vicinamibacteria bacterium]|nr:SCO family protein [Vicinamibacteria bacterium]
MAAMTPVAALLPRTTHGAPAFAAATAEYGRRRIQELHLPNVPLTTHEGQTVRFYDDLVKDKVVTLNFFYTRCDGICPTVSANLAKVQKLLGDQVGKEVFMYSFTLKPEEDTVDAIKRYRASFGARPGWTFLTGKPDDIESLRKAIGFSYPDPAIDKDKTQHIGNVRYGNEPLMLWGACPGMAHPPFVAESISWMVHPDTNRVQAP